MNSLTEIILTKYETITAFLNETDKISKPYLYKMISGKMTNPSKNVIREISRLLDISVEEVMKLTDGKVDEETKEV